MDFRTQIISDWQKPLRQFQPHRAFNHGLRGQRVGQRQRLNDD